ncbi:pilus assembly protein PilP [Hydrogenophaga sp. OTU3427]|uniref:pilus assembly protein PilP n=1 Tax=Hydrogenophaga sp. OTU3427 TaxID=3043856 RepID=UPI00313EF6DE
MTRARWMTWPLIAVAVVALSACDSADNEELSRWMQELRGRTQPKVEPIAEPVRFVPQAYLSEGATQPFERDKLTAALRRAAGATNPNTALLTPELNRRKEPLEAEPLDAMAMVGLLDQKGQRVALVKVNNLLYQVRLGNYLGQNYGRITRITESEITLREIVQDGTGEWIERQAVLQLQEGTK